VTDRQARLDPLALSRAGIDRVAVRRGDDGWLAERWESPATSVLVLSDRRARVVGDPPHLVLVPPAQTPAGLRLFLGVGEAPGGPAAADVAGGDGDGAGGSAYFAVVTDESARPDLGGPDGASWADLRSVGDLLDDRDAGLLVHAVALANWHATHSHCPRCGAATQPALAGSVRRCPQDHSEHYPRTDPAVIMTVVDDADRLLLGRQRVWPTGRFSTLAGFVEPGESLEQAVRREVAEEVGLTVTDVTYLGSQPWPFPSSLMLGFTAHTPGGVPRPDGEEIAQAEWYSRAELAAAVDTAAVRLPPPVSIARRLIEHWYGGPLYSDDRW
jgi:NAD+ diphosphatase